MKNLFPKNCLNCSKEFFSYPCQNRKYCSTSCRSKYTKAYERNPAIGRTFSLSHREALSKSHIGLQAKEKHPRWKGGTYKTVRKEAMAQIQYKTWRLAVFERDNFLCVGCNSSGYLHAHHIKPYSKFPEYRYDIDNGLTFCKDCHYLIHRKAA